MQSCGARGVGGDVGLLGIQLLGWIENMRKQPIPAERIISLFAVCLLGHENVAVPSVPLQLVYSRATSSFIQPQLALNTAARFSSNAAFFFFVSCGSSRASVRIDSITVGNGCSFDFCACSGLLTSRDLDYAIMCAYDLLLLQ